MKGKPKKKRKMPKLTAKQKKRRAKFIADRKKLMKNKSDKDKVAMGMVKLGGHNYAPKKRSE